MTHSTSFLLLVFIVFYSCGNPEKQDTQSFFEIKKYWEASGPDFGTGDISPDGIFFTDINWSTGDLDLINLETNERRPLTGLGYDSGGYAWMSSFSNSGDNIAFEWYNYDTGTHALKLYSKDASTIKTLVPANESSSYWEPMDWTQNDEYILVARQFTTSHWEFGFVSSDSGAYTQISKLDWNAPGGRHPFAYPNAKLSPDDKFIGFDYRTETSESNDIYTISVESGKMNVLFKSKGNDRFLTWNEEGNAILMFSDMTGKPSLWMLPVENGEVSGTPQMISEDFNGIVPLGTTKKGYAFGKRSGNFNTYVTDFNSNTDETQNEFVAVDEGLLGRNNVGAWSKDGHSLLFIRFYDYPYSKESVVIKSLKDQNETEYFFPWNFHNKTGTVAWISNDEILIDGNTPGYSGIHKFNFKEGVLSVPADFGEVGFFQRFKTNSDGSKLFVENRFQNPGIVSFDTNTGASNQLLKGAISPTSTSVAHQKMMLAYLINNPDSGRTSLEIFDLNSKNKKTILSDKQGVLRPPLLWLANDTKLAVGAVLNNEKRGLWMLDIENPEIRVFKEFPEIYGQAGVSINPQNSKLAFQMGQASGELYFLKGF